MKIGFYRDALIGDNLVALNAIYALKALYPRCTLVVYTNNIGIELYSQFTFIDELFNLSTHTNGEVLDHMNCFCFDYFILTQANRWRCGLVNQSNAKKIISLLSLGSILKPKFQTIFISRNLSPTPQYMRLLRLVREIDRVHFDRNFDKINFSAITLQTNSKNIEFVDHFLHQVHAKDYKHLVMLNPFSRTCSHNLTPKGWNLLITLLTQKYPSILFILPTYEGNPNSLDFLPQAKNLALFCNTLDLFNLVELTKRLDLLISPSTGNAHIANNLHIPLLGLFSKRDTMLWRGENMDRKNLLIVPRKKEKISWEEQETLIQKILKKFEEILG